MSTTEERTQNNELVEQAIALAAGDDAAAAAYLRTIAGASRTLDDLVDGDRFVSADAVTKVFANLLVTLPQNPFFLRHREALTALHLMAMNAWLDANTWEQSHHRTRQLYAHVLRDAIGEILPAVAYLTGGWPRMREVSLQIRELFIKEVDHGNV